MKLLSVAKTWLFVIVFITTNITYAQNPDTTKIHSLNEVVVSAR